MNNRAEGYVVCIPWSSAFCFPCSIFDSKWLLRYSISHKQTNNKLRSCARHGLGCSVLNKLTLLTYQYETKQEEG